MVGYDRTLIDVLDVDEILPSTDSSSRPQTLRCTLILFSDKVLVAKRPSGTKTGRQLMGLDDPDHLVLLYQSSHLSSTQASLIGSPKKLKKGSMGYRGHVDLLDVSSVDVGPHDFALSLGDNPPSALPSERWNGRPARRYVVAATYAADVRRAEKEVWLNRFNEAVVCEWLKRGARGAWRSRRIWENEGVENSTEVYYCLWDRRAWEQGRGGKRVSLSVR